jgi:RNA polymerase sigma factor (sigma-70 family)
MHAPHPTSASTSGTGHGVGGASDRGADAARLKLAFLAARAGDAAAAEVLWNAVAPRLLAYARALLSSRDGHDARECLQSALLSMLRLSASRAASIDDVFAFLLTCVRNAAFDMKRARASAARRAALMPARDGVDAMLDAPGSGTLSYEQDALLNRLWTLDEDQRELIILRHVVGLSFDQLALALASPRSTIFSRYKAALARLSAGVSAREQAPPASVPPERQPLPLIGGAPC